MENKDLLKRSLEKYRKLLCNLTRRNKELYYRESSSSISLSQLEIPRKKEYSKIFENFVSLKMDSYIFKELFEKKKLSLNEHFNLKLHLDESYSKRIDKLRKSDDSFQKEFGMSGAWLLGPFLIWRTKENVENNLIISPMFKQAVDIVKKRGNDFSLEIEDDDIVINPTLRLSLENEYGLKLPEFVSIESINEIKNLISNIFQQKSINISYNSNFNKLVRIPPKNQIVKDEYGEILERKKTDLNLFFNQEEKEILSSLSTTNFIIQDLFVLDQINSSRMALYHDYQSIIDKLDNPLITELLLGVPEIISTNKPDRSQLDKYKEKDNYFVVDIDSSQHLAIDMARQQRAIVIQGPPGTGKSQTITNLISQFLAEGKKILFVAEKRAALDVVYQRLKKSNLSCQSIIIHSSDLDRKEMYKSFIDTMSIPFEQKIESDWVRINEQVDQVKGEIISLASAIKANDLKSGLSIDELMSMYSSIASLPYDQQIANIIVNYEHDRILQLCEKINSLRILQNSVPNISSNSWFNKKENFILTEKTRL